jgi:two-component system nitrate/nitrite response regulator NarL
VSAAARSAPEVEPVSVVLIDDHAMFRQALCRLVSADRRVKVVGVAEGGEEGIASAREHRPQVVVTDLRMPGMRGVQVTRALGELLPDVHVLTLTVSEEHEDVLEALRSGARGYVVKSSAQEEIVAAILATARGEAWLSPKVAGRLVDEFRHLPAVTLEETLKDETHLTPREQMVLARLAQGMTNREIAAALGIAETTVKTHLQHILDKLHARNRLEAASFALKLGLVDRPAPDR